MHVVCICLVCCVCQGHERPLFNLASRRGELLCLLPPSSLETRAYDDVQNGCVALLNKFCRREDADVFITRHDKITTFVTATRAEDVSNTLPHSLLVHNTQIRIQFIDLANATVATVVLVLRI